VSGEIENEVRHRLAHSYHTHTHTNTYTNALIAWVVTMVVSGGEELQNVALRVLATQFRAHYQTTVDPELLSAHERCDRSATREEESRLQTSQTLSSNARDHPPHH